MVVRRFSTFEKLVAGAAALVVQCMSHEEQEPVAIMLSGGKTPLPVFEAVASSSTIIPPNMHVMFSDERMVPDNHPESNYGRAKPMLQALGLPLSRTLRVHTELTVEAAADQYHKDIDEFVAKRGDVILGLLGLGADGHTASLFGRDDLTRGEGRWAVSVVHDDFSRVSVTPLLLSRVEHLVFLVSGSDKAAIAEKLVAQPELVTAGLAVAGNPNVELWIV